jgi:inorganic pyrophosphatase
MSSDSLRESIDELVASASVVIDRPKDSAHPRYSDMIYPLDYGYQDKLTLLLSRKGLSVWHRM